MTSSAEKTPRYTAKWILTAEGVIVAGAIIWALFWPSAGSWEWLAPIGNRFLRAVVAAMIVFNVAMLLMLAMQRMAPKSTLMKHLSSGVYMGLIFAFLAESWSTVGRLGIVQRFLFFGTWFALWSWGMSRIFRLKPPEIT